MKKFLKYALKPHWKMIIVILALLVFQTYFQLKIIDLFGSALNYVKDMDVALLTNISMAMLVFTILSMLVMFAISIISTNLVSSATYDVRKRVFHILMNLPDEEISKFRHTGLMTRTVRGIYSEQGFLLLLLKHLLQIPVVVVGIAVAISFIDLEFAVLFIVIVVVFSVMFIFKLNDLTKIFFKAKKTYGNINELFMKRIVAVRKHLPYNSDINDFERACQDSYEKNIEYQLSQYYIAPALFLIADMVMVALLVMLNMGYDLTLNGNTIAGYVMILQYSLYFISTLAAIPLIVERWPRAQATSVRLEEVLDLEDKVVSDKSNKKSLPQRFEFSHMPDSKPHRKLNRNDRRIVFQSYKDLLTEHRFKFLMALILFTISTMCIVYAPKVAENIFNMFISKDVILDRRIIFNNTVLLAVLCCMGYLLQLFSNRIMSFVSQKIAYNLRIEMFDRLSKVSSDFISKNSSGNILDRLNNDFMNVIEFFTYHLVEIFAQFFAVILIVLLMCATDWRMSLIYICVLPVYGICFYCYDIKSKCFFDRHQDFLGSLMGYMGICLDNRMTIRSDFDVCKVEENFDEINSKVKDYYRSSRYRTSLIPPIITFLSNLAIISVYIVGIYFLMNHEIHLGTLLAFIIYAHLLEKPIKKLSISLNPLETSFSSVTRVFDIIKKENKDN